MSQGVAIVGRSGTGKSTSIRTLDPQTTVIIQALPKSLPFKGWNSSYSKEQRNLIRTHKWDKVKAYVLDIGANRPEIKTIILDDIGYVMGREMMDRAMENGYDRFTEIAFHFYQIMTSIDGLRDDLQVVFMFHEDTDDSILRGPNRKIKVHGKMIEKTFSPEEVFTVVLYTDTITDPETLATEYVFVTNRTSIYPAKSPLGMFEEIHVPNDLNVVLDKITEYSN